MWMKIYRYNNFIYLPVFKNASTTYRFLFRDSNWEELPQSILKEININDVKLFGHIQNPVVRHTKGLVEFLELEKGLDFLEIENINRILTVGVFDPHTYPISLIYGEDIVKKTHWIPIDLEIDGRIISCGTLTNFYFEDNNIPLYCNSRRNVSKPYEKEKQNKIKEIKEKYRNHWLTNSVAQIFSKDYEAWEKSLLYYKEYLENVDEI